MQPRHRLVVAHQGLGLLLLGGRERLLRLELEVQELRGQPGEHLLLDQKRPEVLSLGDPKGAAGLDQLVVGDAVPQRCLGVHHHVLDRLLVAEHRRRPFEAGAAVSGLGGAVADGPFERETQQVVDEIGFEEPVVGSVARVVQTEVGQLGREIQ